MCIENTSCFFMLKQDVASTDREELQRLGGVQDTGYVLLGFTAEEVFVVLEGYNRTRKNLILPRPLFERTMVLD